MIFEDSMNVVNMPFSEPSRASEPKTKSADTQQLSSNEPEESSKFGKMVETDSAQDKDKNYSKQNPENIVEGENQSRKTKSRRC